MSSAISRLPAILVIAAGIGAALYFAPPDASEAASRTARPAASRPAAAAAAMVPLPVTEQDEQAADADPFAPRGWQSAPPPVAAVAPVAPPAPTIVVPVAPSAPAGPPTLPFQFMGRMSDGGSGVVYLSRGEESWTVKGGETLDGNYKVVSVTPQQIVFEHLPTGAQQTLAIPEPDK